MIVVDTNVIISMTFETPHSEAVANLHRADPEWAAPHLWRSEFLNVLRHYIKRGLVNLKESFEAIDYAQTLVANREHDTQRHLVVEYLFKSAASSYDCEFVTLAKILDVNLITFDSQLVKEFPSIAYLPADYLNIKK